VASSFIVFIVESAYGRSPPLVRVNEASTPLGTALPLRLSKKTACVIALLVPATIVLKVSSYE
jgi:hypothetical protein